MAIPSDQHRVGEEPPFGRSDTAPSTGVPGTRGSGSPLAGSGSAPSLRSLWSTGTGARTYSRAVPRAFALCALSVWCATDLQGQTRPVGALTETRPVGALQRCPAPDGGAGGEGDVQIRRAAGWTTARIPGTVQLDDVLGVHPKVDARLRVAFGRQGSGILYLTPSLICHPRLQADSVIRDIRLRPGERAVYEVFTDTFRVDGRRAELLAVAVERGALIVEWNRAGAPLFILAAGDTAVIKGTTVAVVVDSTSNEGLFYLETGSAELRGLPGDTVSPGQVLHLRRGRVPVELGPGVATRLRESVHDHSRTGWRTPIRARNVALLGLGGATAGYLAYALWPRSDTRQRGSRTGTVILRLPL